MGPLKNVSGDQLFPNVTIEVDCFLLILVIYWLWILDIGFSIGDRPLENFLKKNK